MKRWSMALRHGEGRVGAVLVLVLLLASVAAPLITAHDPIAQLDLEGARLLAPSLAHPFGTDELSRDVLSRILYGGRISLTIAVLAVAVSLVVGTTVGLVAGMSGGLLDVVLMRCVDAALAVPRLLLLLVIVGLWGSVNVAVLIAILGLTSWFDTSRLVRAEVLSLRTRDYVLAARALGLSTRALLARHVLPNVMEPITVAATLGVGQIVLIEAGLSFLGVGVRRPVPSWGMMIAESQELMVTAPWTAAFPGLAVVLTVVAFSLLGDGLRTAMDPKRS
ncbi:MAG TPA: ABC transporter permease [Gemmatimonadales bacterium]